MQKKIAVPAKRAKPVYHWHVHPQKTSPSRPEPRFMFIWSEDGRPIDMDSDDDDYQTLTLSKDELDRLAAAVLRAYGIVVQGDQLQQFIIDLRNHVSLADRIKELVAENNELRKNQSPVLSVNGKVGHVVLTRDDITNFDGEVPEDTGVTGVQGKVGHVQLTASDFPTSQIAQNAIHPDARVTHAHFGAGTVLSVHKQGTPEAYARIQFDADPKPRHVLLNVSGLKIIQDKPEPEVNETLTFDETDHPNEQTPVKLQHLTYLIPKGICVKRFIPRSLGLLIVDGVQSPLYTDMHIFAENPDGSKVDEIVRFVNPRNEAKVEQMVEDSFPYQTVVAMVKES